MLADQAAAEGGEEKKEETKAEPAVEAENVDGEGDDGAVKSRASARSAQVKQKRPATDKQTAYLEFKETEGKPIEESILMNRNDMKRLKMSTKDITQKINHSK